MLGTKMRALFQRRRGRDLFDLYWALTLAKPAVAPARIIESFQHYLKLEGSVAERAEFISLLDGHLAEWLFTVCRNRAHDLQRREHRMKPLDDIELAAQPSREHSPAAQAEQNESAGHARQFLNHLPPNQQEVVRLKFQNGLSYKEIAGVTNLSVTNVGFKPTFGDHRLTVETFLLDFSGQIDETEMEIEFLYRLRDEMKYQNPAILKVQIQEDARRALKFFRLLKQYRQSTTKSGHQVIGPSGH